MRRVLELEPTAYNLPWGWNSAQRTAWTSSRDVTATNRGLPAPPPVPFASVATRDAGCKKQNETVSTVCLDWLTGSLNGGTVTLGWDGLTIYIRK